MVDVGIAAATESTVCLDVSAGPISDNSVSRSCGFTATNDEPGARDGFGIRERRLDAVPVVQLVGALLTTSRDDDLALLPPAGREQAGNECLADLPAAEDRDSPCHAPSLGGASSRHRHETARPAGQQVHGREPGPLAVRRRAAPPSPSPRLAGRSVRRAASRGRGRRRGRDPSGRAPPARRRRATTGRGRARGAGVRRRPGTARRVGARGRMSGTGGSSAAPRRAWRPRRRSSAGASAPSACADGGAWKRSSAGVTARTMRRSICLASREVISWPQSARSSACATVPTRTGRNPARWLVDRPSS